MCTTCKVDTADSSASESSSSSGSDFSDFETSMEGENNERALEPVRKIRPWRFESPGRNENRARESEEDQWKRIKSPYAVAVPIMVSALHL